MSQVVTIDLLLGWLWRSWNWNRHLIGRSILLDNIDLTLIAYHLFKREDVCIRD